jgi:hypothetical protein
MGVADINFARLKLILVLFLFLILVYSSEFMFFGTSNQYETIEGFAEGQDIVSASDELDNATPNFNLFDLLGSIFDLVLAGATFIFQFMTFTLPSIPVWMTIIFLPLTICIWIILVYLAYDYLYDMIKALPTT